MINDFDQLLDEIELHATPEQYREVLDRVIAFAEAGLVELAE